MNYSTVYIGIDVHKESFSLCCYTNEKEQAEYGDPNDREFQKRLIDTFVNAIFVYDDKLVLTYNYQHGTQTITLNEVEDFLGSDLVGLSPPRNRK